MKRRVLVPAILTAAALALAAQACDTAPKASAQLSVQEATAVTDSKAPRGALRYRFDAQSSKVTWVGAKVTGKHDGAFDRFSGTIDLVEGRPEKGKVTVELDAKSLTSDSAKLTKHLKSADFFDVEKYPKVQFTSTEVRPSGTPNHYVVTGNLALHGVTKSVSFPATIEKKGELVHADADFSFNRRDFGINYDGMANDLIRDDVAVKLAIRAKVGES